MTSVDIHRPTSAAPVASVSPLDDLRLLAQARHPDPFAVLGKHALDAHTERVWAYLPGATKAVIVEGTHYPMRRLPDSDVYEWQGALGTQPDRYRILWRDQTGAGHLTYDPYCFPPYISDLDLHWFNEGRHFHLYRVLGAHRKRIDSISGVLFAVWAPNAERVSVVGSFNQWDGRRHPMRRRIHGVWELFIPGLKAGVLYKFELRTRPKGMIMLKSDPFAQQFECRPATASIIADETPYPWQDHAWLSSRRTWDWLHQPLSIYEVHLGSWRRGEHGELLNYRDIAHQLVEYVKELGFTHIELMPITEHPLDDSWGYQTTGYFAATSRFGTPADLRYFIDYCHQHHIGVILDWVPAHFPKDAHGLARFDGSALYEHLDPRQGEHRDWGTLIFNYGRFEVKNFLLASAVYWLEEFHMDGLRVDAVASMLYLDYSRPHGEWIPNKYGGNENLDAIDFLRELNEISHTQHPGTIMIAEESTSWPQVTRPSWVGGLGFSMKWNMGWMHDTLTYMNKQPIYRQYHHDLLTFGLLYAFQENFILAFSHDEVVHGKRSLLDKMPGDAWQRFANLRLLYTYMWTYPGKKLLFMGCEFAQGLEWNHKTALDWYLLERSVHRGVQRLVSDLNALYRSRRCLYDGDFEQRGFEWIDCHDAPQSVISYLRKGPMRYDITVVVLNFTPVVRYQYRIGVPFDGMYREILNSDSEYYGGSNVGNAGQLQAQDVPWMGRPFSLLVTLPPLAGILFALEMTPEQQASLEADAENANPPGSGTPNNPAFPEPGDTSNDTPFEIARTGGFTGDAS